MAFTDGYVHPLGKSSMSSRQKALPAASLNVCQRHSVETFCFAATGLVGVNVCRSGYQRRQLLYLPRGRSLHH